MPQPTQEQIIQAVLAFVNAKTWAESKRGVETQRDLLLTDAANRALVSRWTKTMPKIHHTSGAADNGSRNHIAREAAISNRLHHLHCAGFIVRWDRSMDNYVVRFKGGVEWDCSILALCDCHRAICVA